MAPQIAGNAQLAKFAEKKKEAAVPTTKMAQKENNSATIRVGEQVQVEHTDVVLDVVARLGKGTFGEVFKVKYPHYEPCLAMKVVRAETSRQIERANEEAELLKKIRETGPNEFILDTYFTFWFSSRDQMVKCFVSELLSCSVFDLLDQVRGRPQSYPVVKAVGYQVLSALDWLHNIGVTHCDIKPDNVMIVDLENAPLRVKLIDFGVARYTRTLRRGAKIQNILYRAPEVVFRLPLTEKVDIWSCGVMLNEIFTGLDLFPARHEPELARYMESSVGLPKEVQLGLATTEFLIYDVDQGRQTVMSYAETQSRGLLDSEADRRDIRSLDQIPWMGQSYQMDKRLREEDFTFYDVLTKMLRPNATERYGAKDALQSQFFSTFDFNYNPS